MAKKEDPNKVAQRKAERVAFVQAHPALAPEVARERFFVQTRVAELTAAGKTVDKAALRQKFETGGVERAGFYTPNDIATNRPAPSTGNNPGPTITAPNAIYTEDRGNKDIVSTPKKSVVRDAGQQRRVSNNGVEDPTIYAGNPTQRPGGGSVADIQLGAFPTPAKANVSVGTGYQAPRKSGYSIPYVSDLGNKVGDFVKSGIGSAVSTSLNVGTPALVNRAIRKGVDLVSGGKVAVPKTSVTEDLINVAAFAAPGLSSALLDKVGASSWSNLAGRAVGATGRGVRGHLPVPRINVLNPLTAAERAAAQIEKDALLGAPKPITITTGKTPKPTGLTAIQKTELKFLDEDIAYLKKPVFGAKTSKKDMRAAAERFRQSEAATQATAVEKGTAEAVGVPETVTPEGLWVAGKKISRVRDAADVHRPKGPSKAEIDKGLGLLDARMESLGATVVDPTPAPKLRAIKGENIPLTPAESARAAHPSAGPPPTLTVVRDAHPALAPEAPKKLDTPAYTDTAPVANAQTYESPFKSFSEIQAEAKARNAATAPTEPQPILSGKLKTTRPKTTAEERRLARLEKSEAESTTMPKNRTTDSEIIMKITKEPVAPVAPKTNTTKVYKRQDQPLAGNVEPKGRRSANEAAASNAKFEAEAKAKRDRMLELNSKEAVAKRKAANAAKRKAADAANKKKK